VEEAMSVAQKDGIKAAEGITYDDLYRRWEQSNWEATSIDMSADRSVSCTVRSGQHHSTFMWTDSDDSGASFLSSAPVELSFGPLSAESLGFYLLTCSVPRPAAGNSGVVTYQINENE
jgi:hypothetical protein